MEKHQQTCLSTCLAHDDRHPRPQSGGVEPPHRVPGCPSPRRGPLPTRDPSASLLCSPSSPLFYLFCKMFKRKNKSLLLEHVPFLLPPTFFFFISQSLPLIQVNLLSSTSCKHTRALLPLLPGPAAFPLWHLLPKTCSFLPPRSPFWTGDAPIMSQGSCGWSPTPIPVTWPGLRRGKS